MAISVCKGTAIQLSISASYTTIGQVLSIDGPEMENETFENRTLDASGSGIGHQATGWTEGGSVSFEIFLDPVLANHQAITDLLTTPADSSWKLIFADAGSTEWPFTGAGVSLSPAVDMADGLKASVSVKLDGIPTLPS